MTGSSCGAFGFFHRLGESVRSFRACDVLAGVVVISVVLVFAYPIALTLTAILVHETFDLETLKHAPEELAFRAGCVLIDGVQIRTFLESGFTNRAWNCAIVTCNASHVSPRDDLRLGFEPFHQTILTEQMRALRKLR